MGATICCEGEDANDGTIVPINNAAAKYKHAGMDEDDKAFFDVVRDKAKSKASDGTMTGNNDEDGQAPVPKPTKQEPAGGPKQQQSDNVPPLVMPTPGTGDVQGYRGRAGALLISLDRSLESNIGLNLDALDTQTAFVDGILPGAIECWNRNNQGINTMKAHDRIISVNGSSGKTDQLLREMRMATKWDIVVDRPIEVKLSVDCKKYPSLGLDLKYSPNGGTLLISGIGAGAIQDWNSSTDGPKIMPQDRIVEVNSIRGTARQLLDTATDVNELTLTVLHYLASDKYDQH